MCGVFGFVGDQPDMDMLRRAALAASPRGPHAHGMAWLNRPRQQRPAVYKSIGPLDMRCLPLAAKAHTIIGHTRYATIGRKDRLMNAHPHQWGDVTLVHNGWVPAYREMFAMLGDQPRTECDSEALAAWAYRFGGRAADRLACAVTSDRGTVATCLAIIHGVPVGVTWHNPLAYAVRREGAYFSSLPFTPDSTRVPNRQVFRLTRFGLETK